MKTGTRASLQGTWASLVPYAISTAVLTGIAAIVIGILFAVAPGTKDPAAARDGVLGNPNWVLWVPALLTIALPILVLLADRIVDIPAPPVLRWIGIPAAAVFLAVVLAAIVTDDPVFDLILIGVIGALLGTVLLDVVRLIGVHVFKAFPLDMPMVFGLIWLGLMQRMQHNMMARMVAAIADLPPTERREALEARIEVMANLPPASREKVAVAMVYGLSRLEPEKRQEVLGTQMEVLADLEPSERVAMMRAMDKAMAAGGDGAYGQPWGMVRIPLPQFRTMAETAIPTTAREGGVSLATVGLAGYFWHFLNGVSLIAPYTLLFGPGNWPLALAWGVFIWLGMMIAMPFMMRMLLFPWWFPIIPLIAHLAMMAPVALLGPVFIGGPAVEASLWGRLAD